ncbi:MAG: hypothetical protein A2161_04710 [Candidatus Schekmanbacteria bacterium RBG_13_48_7]|uniref:Isochorismatase-like domain-containing protein n=1 Tax=Candidatus Schekmanbacteria bacterium RBG_13_48_7 TaxID=1817878 RepID=A0A1F7RQ17_9BACT|nr:MAG: hypothetical protein A2161_04710 [Candidatus Schekmanbacteria bacterium RBG_13_48_7]
MSLAKFAVLCNAQFKLRKRNPCFILFQLFKISYNYQKISTSRISQNLKKWEKIVSFTLSRIVFMSQNLYLKKIESYNTRYALPRWSECALLVIDMQEYFSRLAYPILKNVSDLIQSFRIHKLPVIYTQHGHKNPQKDGGMLAQWWNELILFGSPQWQIIKDIQPLQNEKVIRKCCYSAFRTTSLNSYLRKLKISSIIVSGVMTNLCCETTAREAFQSGYQVFFLADATNTVNEDLHICTLKNLAFGFAHIVDTHTLIENMTKSF